MFSPFPEEKEKTALPLAKELSKCNSSRSDLFFQFRPETEKEIRNP
jgi:hypothetical protein